MDIVILLKVLGATLALVLAVLNLLIMLQLYGKIRLFPWAPDSLAWWHRRQGDVILVIFVLIAYHCVRYAYVDTDSPRVLGHAILGSLTMAVIALKFLTVRWIPRLMDWIAWIGATLFVATPARCSPVRSGTS